MELSPEAQIVLAYHRLLPTNEPKYGSSLIGSPPLTSDDDLDAAYRELVHAGLMEVVDVVEQIDHKTGRSYGLKGRFRLVEGR